MAERKAVSDRSEKEQSNESGERESEECDGVKQREREME